MTSNQPEHALGTFLAGLRAAPSRVLILDYDGTLAPLVEDRLRALPYAGMAQRLPLVRDAGTRVVIVSGRLLAELAALLPMEPLPELWGSHGWERHAPGQDPRGAPLSAQMVRHLGAAADVAAAWVPAERIERKLASVAVHVRGLREKEGRRIVERVRVAWHDLDIEPALRVDPFDGGIEARIPGRDKGNAVLEVLADEPAGASVAYLGDDLTDEDAFRALQGRALTVLVRSEPRWTHAAIRLAPPDEVCGFLDAWIRACSAGEGPAMAQPLRLHGGSE